MRLLVKRGAKGFTPSELMAKLRVPAPTLSFHLKELAKARLVHHRRQGRNLYYGPNVQQMKALVGFLADNCCGLEPAYAAYKPAPAVRQRKRS